MNEITYILEYEQKGGAYAEFQSQIMDEGGNAEAMKNWLISNFIRAHSNGLLWRSSGKYHIIRQVTSSVVENEGSL